MSYKFNPFTGSFDRVEQTSGNQEFELGFDLAIFNLSKTVDITRLVIFEQQALSTRTFTKTGAKQITFDVAVPNGTTINFIQL